MSFSNLYIWTFIWGVYSEYIKRLTRTERFKLIYPRIIIDSTFEVIVLTLLSLVMGILWTLMSQLIFTVSWMWWVYIGTTLLNWYIFLRNAHAYHRDNLQ